MALPVWFGEILQGPACLPWRQPAELSIGSERYAVRTDGHALLALRIPPEEHGPPMPENAAKAAVGWLSPAAAWRVPSLALMEFLAGAIEGQTGTGDVPVGIGEHIYNARLLWRVLSEIEDLPPFLSIGWTAPTPVDTPAGEHLFEAVLIVAPTWRLVAMPLRTFDAQCWRLEDFLSPPTPPKPLQSGDLVSWGTGSRERVINACLHFASVAVEGWWLDEAFGCWTRRNTGLPGILRIALADLTLVKGEGA